MAFDRRARVDGWRAAERVSVSIPEISTALAILDGWANSVPAILELQPGHEPGRSDDYKLVFTFGFWERLLYRCRSMLRVQGHHDDLA